MLKRLLVLGVFGAMALGCGDDGDGNGTPSIEEQDVAISFAALVGSEPFACDGQYTLGMMDGQPSQISELKFYVSELAMINADGDEVPVTLDNDGKWQNGAVALLDFEDGTGACANGTPDLNDTVTGKIPKGDYTGLVFSLGVPFDQNHQDAAVAEAPLNLTQMFWNWQGGYKFLRIDGKANEGGFRVHLGSTGCMMAGENEVSECANPNRPRYAFSGYEAGKKVTLHVERFFEDVDMTPDMEGNSAICMSTPEHVICDTIFEKMDLSFGGNAPQGQLVFTLE